MGSPAADIQRTDWVVSLPQSWTPGYCLGALSGWPGCVALESAQQHAHTGRYSFVSADPVAWFRKPIADRESWRELDSLCRRLAAMPLDGHPPFQGGLAGMISFESLAGWESLPPPQYDPFALPAMQFGLYDVVLAWDHMTGDSWLLSRGWSGEEGTPDADRAQRRAARFLEQLNRGPATDPVVTAPSELATVPLPKGTSVSGIRGLRSSFSPDEYRTAVQCAMDYVRSGDIFQVNLAQHLWVPAQAHALALYRRSTTINPAPFSAYFDWGGGQIVSASPERLFSVRDRQIESRPIKGTRRRGESAESETQSEFELLSSRKDVAENTMIVDLVRNDLSRFCTDDSVVVDQWCGLEKFARVMHLVSVVTGELRDDRGAVDALRSLSPGGSVSGAPKIRALEIIAELESMARGAYCGSLGYLSASGDADFNILIRTLTACRGWWHFPVGGAIVADSDPEAEYEETWDKAAGMLEAIAASHDFVDR